MDNQKDWGNQAVVFKNIKRKEGSNQPEYKLFVTIDGVKYEAGLWTKTGNSGSFLAGKLNKAGEYTAPSKPRESARPQEPPTDTGYGNNLPF